MLNGREHFLSCSARLGPVFVASIGDVSDYNCSQRCDALDLVSRVGYWGGVDVVAAWFRI